MGTDITLHAEIKFNDEWHHYSELHIKRFYDLFAYMANVRNTGQIIPISSPKGLPDDITAVTRLHFKMKERDAYNMSWLSSAEAKKLFSIAYTRPNDHCEDFGYLFGSSYSSYIEDIQDYRFVMWFRS